MSTRKEREIARRLTRVTRELPVPEPPEELLRHLSAEIPADLAAVRQNGDDGEHGNGDGSGKTARPGAPPAVPIRLAGRRSMDRRWLAAAALVMTVGGGWLAWKLWLDGPPAVLSPTASAVREEALSDAAAAHEEGTLETGAADAVASRQAPRSAEPGRAAGASPPAAGRTAAPAAPVAAEPAARSDRRGELRVKVLSDDLDPLPGATVRVDGAADGQAVTDVHGQVAFSDLPAGRYRVRGELDGFSSVEMPSVEVDPDTVEPPLRMSLSVAFGEEIVVSGEVAMPSQSIPPPALARRNEEVRRRAAAEPADVALAIPEAEEADYAARPVADPVPAPASPEPRGAISAEVPKPAARQLSIEASNARIAEMQEERRRLERELEKLEAGRRAQTVEEKAAEERTAAAAAPVFTATAADRLSTFGLDVDTGSYTRIREELAQEWLPDPWEVRVEEVVNYLRYEDLFAGEAPRPGETFRVQADGAPWPFAADGTATHLLRFQVAARPLEKSARKPAVLTLVVDVSGSMQGWNLDMVRGGLAHLLDALEPRDRVALVTFSDEAYLLAPHGDRQALRSAVADLSTLGGTNAEAGLVTGYAEAEAAFAEGASNRVILLSDGLANAGATTVDALLARVAAAANRGIELTTVSVGRGSDDALMEQLADRGDGRYLHVDGEEEAERVFVEELSGTLQTVAEEARVQVELDPQAVRRWRLLGYENRALADREFRYDDRVDAGEVGAGQTVTALYEVELAPAAERSPDQPLALLRLRYRRPGEELFREEELWLRGRDLAASWRAAPAHLRLAGVAGRFAELLRLRPYGDAYRQVAAGLAALSSEASAVASALAAAPRAAELAGLVATAAELAAQESAEQAELAAEEEASRAEEEAAWRWVEDAEEGAEP